MPRGRHTATRFPLVVFIVLCLAVAFCLAGSRAAPLASVRQTRAQGTFVLVPAPVAATPLPEPSGGSSGLLREPSESQSPTPTETARADPEAYRGLTAIGDSIMVDATPNLRARFPGLTVDAVAGRQVAVGIQAMQALAYSPCRMKISLARAATCNASSVRPSQIVGSIQHIRVRAQPTSSPRYRNSSPAASKFSMAA